VVKSYQRNPEKDMGLEQRRGKRNAVSRGRSTECSCAGAGRKGTCEGRDRGQERRGGEEGIRQKK